MGRRTALATRVRARLPQPKRPRDLIALRDWLGTAYYATQAAGGEPGVGTGFGFFVLCRVFSQAVVSRFRVLYDKFTSTPASGWTLASSGTNTGLQAAFISGAATSIGATTYPLSPSDVGKILLVHGAHTGSAVRQHVMRSQHGVDAAITGFTAATTACGIGTRPSAAGGLGSDGIDILGVLSYTGVLSTANIEAVYDLTRALGVLPSAIPGGTVTHLWSAKRALAGKLTINGEVGPASIADVITGAAADVMTRQGSPTVRKIDATIDGRRTYGVQGFSAVSSIDGSASTAPGAAGGFWSCIVARPDATPAGVQMLMGTFDGLAKGWGVQLVPQLRFGIYDTGGLKTSSLYTIPAADVGQRKLYAFHFTGSQLRVYADGVQQGADVASGPVWQTDAPFRFGRNGASHPTLLTSIFGASYGAGNPTLAQIQQLFTDFAANGRVPSIAGMTDFRVDFTDDVIASGGPSASVPSTYANRAGAGTLTRVDVDTAKSGPNGIRGVGPYAATDSWRTLPGGGIQGASGGFHVVVDWVPTAVPSATSRLIDCNVSGSETAWSLQGLVGGGVRLLFNGASCGSYNVQASDVGKRLRFIINYNGTVAALHVNGVAVGNGVVAFTPSGAAMQIGSRYDAEPWLFGQVELVQGGNFSLSAGELSDLFADLTQPAPLTPGKTEKRWRFEQDIAANGGTVPRQSVERISGASADALLRKGSGLAVAQRVDRLWSYESAPIFYGMEPQAASLADYLQAAINALPGDPAGFVVTFLGRPLTVSGTSKTRYLMGQRGDGNQGWNFVTTGTNSILLFGAGGNTTAVNSPSASLGSADVGKLCVAQGVWDAVSGRARLYFKRTEAGAGTALSGGYAPDTAVAPQIGRVARGGIATVDGWQIYGMTYAVGNPSLAQLQSQCDAIMVNERIVQVPGMTGTVIDLDQDIRANANAMPASVVDRGGGGVAFARVGAPSVVSHHARNWGW